MTNQHNLINVDTTKDMCRVLVHIREFVSLLDHNYWRFFVVLDSCWHMGKWRAMPRPCMTFEYIFYVRNTSIFPCKIYVKRKKMGWFKILSIVTFIVVFKFRIMLSDFNILFWYRFHIFFNASNCGHYHPFCHLFPLVRFPDKIMILYRN